MKIGFTELLLILVIVFVLFGAGRLPKVMGDLGKGLHSLRKGLAEGGQQTEMTSTINEQEKNV